MSKRKEVYFEIFLKFSKISLKPPCLTALQNPKYLSVKEINKSSYTKQCNSSVKKRNFFSLSIPEEKAPYKKQHKRKNHGIHGKGSLPLENTEIEKGSCKPAARTGCLQKQPAWTGISKKKCRKQQIKRCCPNSHFIIIPILFYSFKHPIFLFLFIEKAVRIQYCKAKCTRALTKAESDKTS